MGKTLSGAQEFLPLVIPECRFGVRVVTFFFWSQVQLSGPVKIVVLKVEATRKPARRLPWVFLWGVGVSEGI